VGFEPLIDLVRFTSHSETLTTAGLCYRVTVASNSETTVFTTTPGDFIDLFVEYKLVPARAKVMSRDGNVFHGFANLAD
jgi:hypothetical protein